MPGYIKVDGAYQPVAAPYVKVDGTWTPVALGYVKVDGEWKIWHSAEIEDDFNRPNSPNLGTASNTFSQWTELSGSWEIRDNAAYHPLGSGVAIATTPLYKASTDYKVQVDIPSGTGLGAAFWAQDANNWYAAIPGVREQFNPGYYVCPSGYISDGSTCYRNIDQQAVWVPSQTIDPAPYTEDIYGCPSGYSSFGSQCRKATGTTTSTYEATCTTTTTATCPSGYRLSGGTCTKTIISTCSTSTSTSCIDPATCSGSCVSLCGGGFRCSCRTSTTICRCPNGNTTGGAGEVCGTETTTPTSTTTTTCTCPNGGTRSGTTCTVTETTYDYTSQIVVGTRTVDPDPYTIPGYWEPCPSGSTRIGDRCIGTEYVSATYIPPSTSYPSVIRIFRNLSGTVSQVFSQDISSDPRSIEVSTTGNNIGVSLYSAANLGGSRIASVSHTEASPIRARGVGIARNGDQVQRNGNSIDNFRAE